MQCSAQEAQDKSVLGLFWRELAQQKGLLFWYGSTKKVLRTDIQGKQKIPHKQQSYHHYVFKFKVFTGLSSNSTDMVTHSTASSCKPLIWIILSVCSPLQQLLSAENDEIWEETDQKAEAQSSGVTHLKFYRKQTEIHKLNWFWLLILSVGLKISPMRISITKQKQPLPSHFMIFL